MPGVVMKEFRAGLRIEVVVPGLEKPSKTDPLDVMMYRAVNGKATAIHTTMPQFKACDTRFEVGKPVVFLYWKTEEPWSLIMPGRKQYQQFQTLYYDDKNGKRWESGEVISKTYLANMTLPSIVHDFALLDNAYERLKAHSGALNEIQRLQKQLATLDRKIAAWSKVALPEKQRNELLQRATLFEIGDRAAPRGLLLTGPPGTDKTQIARTLANEGGLGFLAATTADVKANFLGQSGNRVKQLFERARANAPVILFLDELDIIAPARSGSNDALTDEIVGQLLQELDGIQSRDSEVFLLALPPTMPNRSIALCARAFRRRWRFHCRILQDASVC
jgi:hypothetical protein